MKAQRSIFGLAVLGGALLSSYTLVVHADGNGAAGAAPTEQRDHRGGHHGRHHGPKNPEHLIKRFDANGDGKLSVTELPEHMREHMASADTNADGVLSVEELTARFQERDNARFARADKNADGSLTADEVSPRFWTFIQKADTDGNGRVTQSELSAARANHAHGQHHQCAGHDVPAPSK